MGTPPPERAPKRARPDSDADPAPPPKASRSSGAPSSHELPVISALAHYDQGEALLRAGDAEDALTHFRAATAIDGAHADAWARTGCALRALRRDGAGGEAAGGEAAGDGAAGAAADELACYTRALEAGAAPLASANRARAPVRLGGALAEGADDDAVERALTRLRDGLAAAIAAAEPAVECEAHYAFAALLGPRLGRWREARASLERGQAAWAHATSGAWASVHIEEPDDYPLGPRDEEEEEEEGA